MRGLKVSKYGVIDTCSNGAYENDASGAHSIGVQGDGTHSSGVMTRQRDENEGIVTEEKKET